MSYILPTKNCSFCNNILLDEKRTFCSMSCRGKFVFHVSQANGWTFKGRHHTELTRKKISEGMPGKTGRNSRNWKGGISRTYRTGYYSPRYKKWRTDVFERDNYTCKKCLTTGDKSYLTAHHIKSFAYYPKLRFKLSNGITLCELCHSKTDNYKGRNTKFKRAKNFT